MVQVFRYNGWLTTVCMVAGWCGAMLLLTANTARAAEPSTLFEQQVYPLLQARCAGCHDARKQTASYRIDVRRIALRGGESGDVAIVPGDAATSALYQRVTTTDEATRMPPEGPALTLAEQQLIEQWITSGATWPDHLAGKDPAALDHWAFQPPRKSELPQVANHGWVKNEVDQFILARLEAEQLPPNEPADRVTLLRRLSLDLTGLPPTPAEVDAFLADDTPTAYDRAVERLLESPHYGERWARMWLDGARYADSDGFEKDKPRSVWFYRDWVINALNRDLPYNQFVVEQLAGDLLPGATQDQLVATGFLRNSMINEEGGVDPEQFRMEAMFDRMDAIGKSVLGLTIQCAQCHDHKYDPLSQVEYYQLFAYFNDCHEASLHAYTPAEQVKRTELATQIRTLEAGLMSQRPDWEAAMMGWEQSLPPAPVWTTLQTETDDLSGGQKMYRLPDGSYLCQGYAPTKHTAVITVNSNARPITAFRLELLNDPNLPLGGPGRSLYGTGALTEFKVQVRPLAGGEAYWVKFVRAISDASPPEAPLAPAFDDQSGRKRVTGPIEYAIDDKDDTAWSHDLGAARRNQPVHAVFVPSQPIDVAGGVELQMHLVQNHGGWNSDDNQTCNLGRFRLSLTSQPAAEAYTVPLRLQKLLSTPAEARSASQKFALFSHWRTTVPEWGPINQLIEELWYRSPVGTSQLTLASREMPRTTHLLKRGDFLKPAEVVTAGVPAVLGALPSDASPDRLTLARWLTRDEAPTTARSIVNRVWQAYFGTGLVSTSEDLGRQSDTPSHPELLDWLSADLVEQGWSLKGLHRRIVKSAMYRQSAVVRPDHLQRDPDNRLLARSARFRLDAEVVRDIALGASGLLQSAVGGASVYPPLPAFMLQPPVSYGPKTWHEETGPNRYRRSLYTFRFRSLPYPVLQTFDAPNGDFSCVRRARSNTPLQALMTLNEPVFVECAAGLAVTALREPLADDTARLNYAFRRCVSRPAEPAELEQLRVLLAEQRRVWQADTSGATQLASLPLPGLAASPEEVTLAERAAWTIVARVLLNLDETISRP